MGSSESKPREEPKPAAAAASEAPAAKEETPAPMATDGASVEDLVKQLSSQMKNSTWLEENKPAPGAKSVFEEGWADSLKGGAGGGAPPAASSAAAFPTAAGGEAGRWCPDGRGDGTHVAR